MYENTATTVAMIISIFNLVLTYLLCSKDCIRTYKSNVSVSKNRRGVDRILFSFKHNY